MTLTLDHVGWVGRDLDALRGAFIRLGFAPTAPTLLMRNSSGERQSLQQISAHAVLRRGYVEISAVSSGDPGHHLAAYVRRFEGMHILAIGSRDIQADRRRCLEHGFAPTAVAEANREIEYGTRHGTARFQWFMLSPAVAREGLVCFVDNQTPELVFQAQVSVHPNGAQRVEGVTVVAEDAGQTVERYTLLLDRPAAVSGDAARFSLGEQWIEVLTPALFGDRFPAARLAGVPCLASLTVEVASRAQLLEWMRAHAVPLTQAPDGAICATLHEPDGAVVCFKCEAG